MWQPLTTIMFSPHLPDEEAVGLDPGLLVRVPCLHNYRLVGRG